MLFSIMSVCWYIRSVPLNRTIIVSNRWVPCQYNPISCQWVLFQYDSEDGIVLECNTIEEANAFIAQQQQNVMDHSKSWVTNHLKLPAPAVALIYEYTKAWTPPCPFFLIEEGELRVYVKWESDFCDPYNSQYIARNVETIIVLLFRGTPRICS